MTSALRVASSASGKRRRHDDVAEQREDRLEILRQAGAGQREQMPGDADRQRDAAAVEILGDVARPIGWRCRDRSRATADTSRPGASAGSQTDPARIARLMVTAGILRVSLAMTTAPFEARCATGSRPARDVEACGSSLKSCRASTLDGVSGLRASGFGLELPIGSGSNQPTVRLDGVSTVCATVGDLVERHRRDARRRRRESCRRSRSSRSTRAGARCW